MILRTSQSDEITVSEHGDKIIVVDPPRSGAMPLALSLLLTPIPLLLMLLPTRLGLDPGIAGILICIGMVSVFVPMLCFFEFLRARKTKSRLVIGPTRCIYAHHGPCETRTHEFDRSDFEGFVRRDNEKLYIATADGLLPFHRGFAGHSGETTRLNHALLESSEPERVVFENDVFRLREVGNFLICKHVKNGSPVFELRARPDGVVLLYDGIVRHKCAWRVNPRMIFQDNQLFFVGNGKFLRILATPHSSMRDLAVLANSFISDYGESSRARIVKS